MQFLINCKTVINCFELFKSIFCYRLYKSFYNVQNSGGPPSSISESDSGVDIDQSPHKGNSGPYSNTLSLWSLLRFG
jgi:hypothetical protein